MGGISGKTNANGFLLICDFKKPLDVSEIDGQMSDSDSGKCDVGVAGLFGSGVSVAQNISSHLFQVATWELRPPANPELAAERYWEADHFFRHDPFLNWPDW